MAMILGLETVKPPNLDIVPTSANFTIPGQVKVYVHDTNKNATAVAFTLGAVSPVCSVLHVMIIHLFAFTTIDCLC